MTFSKEELQKIEALADKYKAVKEELSKAIVGHSEVLDHILIAIFSGGHCLLVGVPGLGKTLMIQSLAEVLDLDHGRVQFTPDLMPSDIVGSQIVAIGEKGQKEFRFLKGPIFTNLFLADEINRTPPKTQAALMEAMEERQVSVSGRKMPLPCPFFTMATQNFVEQEGIYPLPFAQLDRFMFQLQLSYPTFSEEMEIVEKTTSFYQAKLSAKLSREEILYFAKLVKSVSISSELMEYAVTIGRATRPESPLCPSFLRQWLECGVSPRGPQNMILASKAWAMLQGRTEVCREDIEFVAPAVLEHRLILSYHAQVERISPKALVLQLLEHLSPKRRRWFRLWPLFTKVFSHKKSPSSLTS